MRKYDQLKQEEVNHSKSIKESTPLESYNLQSPRTSLGRELMDEGFPQSTCSFSNTSHSPVKLRGDFPSENVASTVLQLYQHNNNIVSHLRKQNPKTQRLQSRRQLTNFKQS